MALIARDIVDLYGALIVVGFIGMFGFQIFENIAMTMGIMPVAASHCRSFLTAALPSFQI